MKRSYVGVFWVAAVTGILGCDEFAKQLSQSEKKETPAPVLRRDDDENPPPASPPKVATPPAVDPVPVEPAKSTPETLGFVVYENAMFFTTVTRGKAVGLEFVGTIRLTRGDLSLPYKWAIELKNKNQQVLRQDLTFAVLEQGKDLPFVLRVDGTDVNAPFFGRIIASLDGKTVSESQFMRFQYKNTQ